jgi:hypothetical protein
MRVEHADLHVEIYKFGMAISVYVNPELQDTEFADNVQLDLNQIF